MPDFRDRTVWYSSNQPVGSKEGGSLPNIVGSLYGNRTMTSSYEDVNNWCQGALFTNIQQGDYALQAVQTYNYSGDGIRFDASKYNPKYGISGDIVIPTAIDILFVIKY